ncbi:MAG TPA: TPM domain-containing protein, partial [Thermoanaerobaculia bacterium]|nr:TPM domain-containing protein [Thermoanaerobaculia bacterium]
MWSRYALAVLLVLLAIPLLAKDVPFLSGRVDDTAGMLPPEARQRIEDKLKALEQQTGAQVAVLTVDSLDGEVLEDYSHKVAQTWGLGKKGKDNGVLLLISKSDRKIRIEVGYGLEGQLTDLQNHVIIDEIMRPEFQRGDFAGGIEKGVGAIVSAVSGKGVPTPEKPAGRPNDLPVAGRALFGLIFLVVIGTFSLVALSTSGCQSWFLYLFLTPFYFTFPMAIGGPALGIGLAVGWLVLFPVLRLLFGRRTGGGGFWRGGGWPIFFPGGFLGGGGGGWSSRGGGWGGGGGFSGGGGGFGGGGASG